jgi:hypothetical protein
MPQGVVIGLRELFFEWKRGQLGSTDRSEIGGRQAKPLKTGAIEGT